MVQEERPTLASLGPRICLLGPSNSGKSTLAVAIGRARHLSPVHLDQLQHRPGSDWVPRAEEAFLALQAAAILGDRWVMDGSYSRCLPQRLARATGLILLDVPTATSVARYVRRCWFERGRRVGGLAGGRDSVKWVMIRHIVVANRAGRKRSAALFDSLALPRIRLASAQAIRDFYEGEGLVR
ncbi:AAA family ATPase [Sphingobium sufflavum]|uniref:AAA family ATPase n=1 Tax=Sphingobium sufflavum TaxID=1129547 RepID=UPI001F3AB7CF|nr:AAA family ATPase [Sphingobium sufflavum]MCE7795311.1 AAA family ATPase [Sphingobium sufflavum]